MVPPQIQETAEAQKPDEPPAINVAAPAPTAQPVAKVETKAAPAPAPVAPKAASFDSAPKSGGLNWAALRKCESSGNYQAVSKNGKYRGAYQFDMKTWAGYGPAGDPAQASPAEQDRRAQLLYQARGIQPWPRCGKLL